jgi:hypothetical protein
MSVSIAKPMVRTSRTVAGKGAILMPRMQELIEAEAAKADADTVAKILMAHARE